MKLVVVRITLKVMDGILPVCSENVLILPGQALVDVRPSSSVEFGRREALRGELDPKSISTLA